MRIVYIAGAAHSGSTLLDLMLNAHPDVQSCGELKQLPRFVCGDKTDGACSCGAPSISQCAFWSAVGQKTQQRIGRGLADLRIDSFDGGDPSQNAALFEGVAEVAGANWIVDSSKSASRLRFLLDTPGLDVFPIYLIRDPKGQILSAICSAERKKKPRPPLLRVIRNYLTANLNVERVIRGRPHARVRYEELMTDPQRVLGALMDQLGLAFDPTQLEWASHVRHNIGGNRIRRTQSSELKLDEAWRTGLGPVQKAAIDFSTIPLRLSIAMRGGYGPSAERRNDQPERVQR